MVIRSPEIAQAMFPNLTFLLGDTLQVTFDSPDVERQFRALQDKYAGGKGRGHF
jgi:hypothetical protein